MKYLKEAAKFLNEIKKEDETLVIFNNDGDGICAAALVAKFLQRTGRKKPYFISQPMPMDKNLVQRIKTTLPNKIIFLDLVVDQQEDIVKKIRSFADILIVDHHQITNNLNGKTIVHFNPRFTNPKTYTSTTYNVYKICTDLLDMEDALWIAIIGVISDYALEDSKDIIEVAKKKYHLADDLHKSQLAQFSNMIFSARATKELSCEQMVEIFLKSGDVKDLESMEGFQKMLRSHQLIEEEIAAIMADAENNLKKDGGTILYNVKSKYNLDAVISTKISERHMDKLVIVYSKTGTRYKISARNQKKNLNAGRIMQLATRGLKASGGGHEAAAGAVVDEKDWEKFLENVNELAGKKQ
jgi:single-stranded DNA-specific DHH superfamily exonuclease